MGVTTGRRAGFVNKDGAVELEIARKHDRIACDDSPIVSQLTPVQRIKIFNMIENQQTRQIVPRFDIRFHTEER